MAIEAKRQLERLIRIWATLFGSGFELITAALWTRLAGRLGDAEPLLVFVWLGQALLFLFSMWWLRSIARPAQCIFLLCAYKAAAGLAMLVLGLRPDQGPEFRWITLGGALLDLSMGAITFLLWRLTVTVEPTSRSHSSEAPPVDPLPRVSRCGREVVSASIVVSLAVSFLVWFPTARIWSSLYVVAVGNLGGVYASLGVASFLGFRNILWIANLCAAATLLIWCTRFALPIMDRRLFLVAGFLHLACAAWLSFPMRSSRSAEAGR